MNYELLDYELLNYELLDLVGIFHHTFKLLRSNKLLQLKEVIEMI